MANILKFPGKAPQKFGFERVRKIKKQEPRRKSDQMDLFVAEPARIIEMSVPPDRLFERALALDELGDDGAAAAYQKSIEKGACVPDAYCNLGVLESLAGRRIQALDCFTNALKHDPRHFEAHYNLANLYLDSNDLDLAEFHYGMAAGLEPDFPNTYFNLGLVNALKDQLDAAVSALSTYKELVSDEEAHKADDLLNGLKDTAALRRQQAE